MISQPLKDYLNAHQERFTQELTDFLRIPSVSTSSEHKEDVRRAASFVVEKLQAAGLETELIETPRHPVVYGSYHVGNDAPTVLIYGHYDVQPPEPLELWNSPPFEPKIEEGVIYARGATDDKGQVYAHIKGVEALLKTEDALKVNVKFLVEGEEEIGSPSLDKVLEAHRDRFAADVVIISDGSMIAPDTPTITYGLKGLAYVEVNLRGAAMDLHSGAFGGGVPNPINGLAKVIAQLHDEAGRVAVPGFYDDVADITDEEREAFAKVPFDEERFAQEIGVSATPGEAGYTLLERLWARPTLDVNGIAGGFQGEGAKTVITDTVMAKISCRLVPNQDPADITKKLGDYLQKLAPEGLEVRVTDLHGGYPALTPLDSPALQAASRALKEVYEKDPIYARTGGTIPVVSTFQQLLGAEVVLVGFGLENDRMHSPNEKFDIVNYYKGIETSAALLQAFSK